MSSPLREILAIFSTEVDDTGLKKGEAGVESFKKTLLGFGGILAGAFAVHEIVDFGRDVLESADQLAKQSQALSVSAAELQGWQWAAKLSGSSAEEFSAAFTKFNRNVAEAAKGTGPAAEALKLFGITAEDVKKKTPIALLDDLAAGLDGVQDPAKRTAAFMALFGKSGAKLLPLFLEGAEGVKKLRAEVSELGMSFDEQFLEDAQEVNDNVDRLKLGFKGLGVQALKPLLPLITDFSKATVGVIKWVIEALKQSNALKVGLIVFGTVGAVKATNAMVQLAQKAGFLKNGLRGVMLQLLPLVAAFLVLEDVWTFLTGGDSVTGDLISKFFGADAPEKVKAFATALKDAGIADFAELAKTAFAIFTDGKPLNVKFKELLAYIDGPFATKMVQDFGLVGAAITVWVDLLARALSIAEKLVEAVKAVADATLIKPARKAVKDAEGEQALIDDAAAGGQKPATAADVQEHLDKSPWYLKLIASATGFDASKAVPVAPADPAALFAQQQIASLPASNASLAPVVHQTLQQNVTQQITAETPADLKRAARDGAKEGLTEGGEYLRTQRALVPSP